jgi:urea ABC transporter ATP-binding protein UrtE
VLLQVKEISVFYEQSCICDRVSLDVDNREVVCLLGRNGVGKTTLLKRIMGLLPPRSGTIIFDGQEITSAKPYEVAKLGMAYVPQGRLIFPNLTVLENLRIGTTPQKSKIKMIPELVFKLFPVLEKRLKQLGGTLSGGEQQMLAIGRGLSGLPKLLLLDEPLEGLFAAVSQEVIRSLRKLKEETDLAILLVEQNLDMALETATRGYILEKGRIVVQGNSEELQKDEIVKSHLAI